MRPSFTYIKLIAASAAFLAFSAHAELQSWKLVGTVYQQTENFTAPAFAAPGKTVTVDYVIDTAVTPSFGSDFNGAVVSFTINGVKSAAAGYISASGEGLNAINVWPASARADNIDFLSFNRFGGPITTTVTEAINDFSVATSSGAFVDFRIDFGTASTWVKPTSFTKQTNTFPAHCNSPVFRKTDPLCPAERPSKK
jgi:hypothetical protein